MAKVWPVYEGKVPTLGWPWADMPLDDAISVLELNRGDFLSDLAHTPRFGDPNVDLTLLGTRHIVVEIGEEDAIDDWQPGFYRSRLAPAEAFRKVLEWRIRVGVGDDWQVDLEEGTDSDGDRALWARVVLKASAPAETWRMENREHIEDLIRNVVSESGSSDWVFVRFRKEDERAMS